MTTPSGYCIQFPSYADKDSILQEYENIRIGLGVSVVANFQQSSSDAYLQLSYCHGKSFYKPSFAEALERNESCCNRNGESKPNGKCSIARYGQNEKEKHRSLDVVSEKKRSIDH